MTDTPIFPVLRLLTDQEVERALNRSYSLQEGPNQRDYLRSDRPGKYVAPVGICFLGEAFGLADSPSAADTVEHLAPRTAIKPIWLLHHVKAFMKATDLIGETTITDDAMLRAVVRASRAAP